MHGLDRSHTTQTFCQVRLWDRETESQLANLNSNHKGSRVGCYLESRSRKTDVVVQRSLGVAPPGEPQHRSFVEESFDQSEKADRAADHHSLRLAATPRRGFRDVDNF
jgi:hypothetical protein